MMFTMLPSPLAFNAVTEALLRYQVPKRFTSITRRNTSSETDPRSWCGMSCV